VVRLKGGDPYLFGRGAEEAVYLANHGIACEVVPGVTAGMAAPASAGIPVTHRKMASTVTFVTGHEDPTKDTSSVDYRALAGLIQAGGTVCFYMGVGRLPAIAEELHRHGLAMKMPAAVVQWGTLPRQRSVRTTLGRACDDVASAGLGAPAIIVVGQVAAIDEPGLNFFTSRPLFAQTVLITRTRQQASTLRMRLEELGAQTIEAPTIELIQPDDWAQVDQAIENIKDYDWLILTSVNGVDALANRLDHLQCDARHLAGVQIAAIGDATADALQQQLRLRADLVPTRFVAESLAAELIAQHDVQGKHLLLLRADIARPALPKLLTQAGAKVIELTVYQTKRAETLSEDALAALREKRVDWVTLTSSSTVTNLVEMLGDARHWLEDVKLASIGPITSDTARQLGLNIAIEATTSNIDGLVEAMVAAVS